MKVLITGATGFVGQRIVKLINSKGWTPVITTRSKAKAEQLFNSQCEIIEWDPQTTEITHGSLEGITSVINLMGENISSKRWSEAQKKKIYDSRVVGTKNLIEMIKKENIELDSFISTSAIGIYPESNDQTITEETPFANNFLADVCKDWEKATSELTQVKRKVILRVGVVLGKDGGALLKLLPIFKLGLGGPIGNGKQFMSWIEVEDLANLYVTALSDEAFNGVYNAVAPGPVSNTDFTKALAKAVNRPAIFPVPPFMLKTVFGEMSCIMLDGQNIQSTKIKDTSFKFSCPNIDDAFKKILN